MLLVAAVRALLFPALLGLVGACATEPEPTPDPPQPLERIWAEAIRPGDVFVLVPGTGSKDYLATPIEAMPGDHPSVDVRADALVRSDSIVFEQAIAAARRAGLSDAEIQDGHTLTFLLWGAGFERLESFDYVSYDKLHVRIDILGGLKAVGVGLIEENYLGYTSQSADTDARDIYTRLGSWLTAHPSSTARNVSVMAHSWGGAVAEYLTFEYKTLEHTLGPLPGGTAMPFTVAAGVPGYILGYDLMGPGVIDFARPSGGTSLLYEIDRPDDPVHNMSFEGDYGGHYYNIVVADQFLGSYGISTDDLSCRDLPGACTP